MKFFIQWMNHGIWKAVKEDPYVSTHGVNGVVVNKPKKIGPKMIKKMCNLI